jgi:hypothetical protein
MPALVNIIAAVLFFSCAWLQNTLLGWDPVPRAPVALVFLGCLAWYGKAWRERRRGDVVPADSNGNRTKPTAVLLAILGTSWLVELALLVFATVFRETGDFGQVYSDVFSLCVTPECADSARVFHLHSMAFLLLAMSFLAYHSMLRSLTSRK